MGLLATAAERPGAAVHLIHPVEEQGDRRLQDCRPRGAGAAVGHPEEPPEHELRQDESGSQVVNLINGSTLWYFGAASAAVCTACLTPDPQVLLPCEHPAEGAGRTALLPVPSEPNGAEVNKKHLSAATANGGTGCSTADCRPAGRSGCRPHQVGFVSQTQTVPPPPHRTVYHLCPTVRGTA